MSASVIMARIINLARHIRANSTFLQKIAACDVQAATFVIQSFEILQKLGVLGIFGFQLFAELTGVF